MRGFFIALWVLFVLVICMIIDLTRGSAKLVLRVTGD